jgi:hypothetical protein
MAKKSETTGSEVVIAAPAFKVGQFKIRGTTPFVQLRFSQKQKNKIKQTQAEGGKEVKTKRVHERKDFDALYEEAMYLSDDGHRGINALSFKKAMVAACRLTNMNMKMAKMSFFVIADGYDSFEEDIPLIYFTKGDPEQTDHICRNANGMPDLRVRARWNIGWEATLRVKYDSDIISLNSLTHLLTRAGTQVGIGEGRPDSTKSDGAGMGWGTFEILAVKEVEE